MGAAQHHALFLSLQLNWCSPDAPAGSPEVQLTGGIMNHPVNRLFFAITPAGVVALSLQGCGVSTSTTPNVAPRPDQVEISITPQIIQPGGVAYVKVVSPSADSISLEAAGGVDRFWETGPVLHAQVGSEFGDTMPAIQYAVRDRGQLLDVLKKPMKIVVCRKRDCREFYRELAVRLPERNERSVAVTVGGSTAFTRRAVTSRDKSVLLREALNHSVWDLQAELATGGLNVRLQGFLGAGDRGGSLDISREISRMGEGMSYGLAMHVAAAHAEWLPIEQSAALSRATVYRASVGPSIMIKGLTASSQVGLYTDGRSTMQEVSTFLSLNGGLTEVRSPVTVTVEKTFAFGGEPMIPRRQDQLERLTLGINVIRDFALRLGMTTHRSAWPTNDRATDLTASEVYYTLGGQWTISW
jgi:hypothetical protein